jgi:hypothetical protein
MAVMAAAGNGVRSFLITTDNERDRLAFWMHMAAYANWIEGRTNRHGTDTWLITVLESHGERFLKTAERDGHVTVEEIVFRDDTEHYELRVGEEETGWAN